LAVYVYGIAQHPNKTGIVAHLYSIYMNDISDIGMPDD
jgi:hypothetical protein